MTQAHLPVGRFLNGRAIAASIITAMLAGSGTSAAESQVFGPGHDEPEFQETVGQATPLEPLINGTPRPTRTIAGMMFDISGGPPNMTTLNTLIGPTGKLRQMYREISYGMQDIAIDLKGPDKLPVANCLSNACCGPASDRVGNGATVQQLIDGYGKKYDHYFYVYGGIPAGASCGTWGDEGTAEKPAVYSSYSQHSVVAYSQELGHNFGMTHEPILTNCSGTNKTFPDNPGECTHSEYGSPLSFMGKGPGHPSTYHKVQLGWLSKCNGVKVRGTSTFTLMPQELACDGVQVLQIPSPKSRPSAAAGDRQNAAPTLTQYYVEMRAPHGFDAQLFSGRMVPMVLVSAGPDFSSTTMVGAPYVYVLNLTPATTDMSRAGLTAVGQKFDDPAGGLTITLDAIDASSATVTVTMASGTGSHTCLDGAAFTAPGPGPSSCAGLVGIDGGFIEAGTGADRDAATGGAEAGTDASGPGSEAGSDARGPGAEAGRDASGAESGVAGAGGAGAGGGGAGAGGGGAGAGGGGAGAGGSGATAAGGSSSAGRAGSGGSGNAGGAGGAGGSGGESGKQNPSSVDGCSCRFVGRPAASGRALAGYLVLLGAVVTRRSRSRALEASRKNIRTAAKTLRMEPRP